MGKCKYCTDIDFPRTGKHSLGELDLIYKVMNFKWFELSVSVNLYPDDKEMAVNICNGRDTERLAHKKIKYCPMCGRKL